MLYNCMINLLRAVDLATGQHGHEQSHNNQVADDTIRHAAVRNKDLVPTILTARVILLLSFPILLLYKIWKLVNYNNNHIPENNLFE